MDGRLKFCGSLTLAIAAAACQPMIANQPDIGDIGTAGPTLPEMDVMADDRSGETLAFAQTVCADCHAVEAPGLSPNPNAPPFADIANRHGLSAQTLSTFLRDAHNYPEAMDFDLDPPQIDALTRYMLTLREEGHRPEI